MENFIFKAKTFYDKEVTEIAGIIVAEGYPEAVEKIMDYCRDELVSITYLESFSDSSVIEIPVNESDYWFDEIKENNGF